MPTDVTELVFPAVQTYSSGEEVAWIDQPTEGTAEVEHPAPTLELVAATGEDDADDGTDTLAIVPVLVGAVGLIVAGIALIQTRRASTRRTA